VKQSPLESKIASAAIAVGTTIDTKLERNMDNATEGLSSQYFNLLHRLLREVPASPLKHTL